MPQGSPQFTPRQLLDAGLRAEAEGKLDHANQLYRHLTDHYAYTTEAAEARNGLGPPRHRRRPAAVGRERRRGAGGLARTARRQQAVRHPFRRQRPAGGDGAPLSDRARAGDAGELRGLADRRCGRGDGAAGAGGRPADAAERLSLTPCPWGLLGAVAAAVASPSPVSRSCSGARWRARCSTRPTPRASWSPSSARGRPAIRIELGDAAHPLRRCSSRRGMISTKLQGRWRLSSCHLRMSFQASLQAPGEPGRQKM